MKAKKKYPDVESVLEVIRTRDEMELPLSPGQLNTGKYPDPDLHKAGIRLCGTWQKAVEAAGFNYTEMLNKAKSRYPTAGSIIREIQNRHKGGLPLCVTDVGVHPGPHRDCALHSAAKKRFGSWRNAVEAAGIEYAGIRRARGRRYPDKASILAEIKHRAEAGLPLNASSLSRGENADTVLYFYGAEYFGDWPVAIETAGFCPEKMGLQKPNAYTDKASVVLAVQQRVEAGLPINASAICSGTHKDTSMYSWGLKYFGNWEAVIEAAGIPYGEVRHKPSRRYPGKASVVAEIRRRKEGGLPLNGLAVAKGQHRDKMLHCYAQEYFGSWEATLEATGISPEEVGYKHPRGYPDASSIEVGIQRRAKAGLPLNGLAVAKGEHRDQMLHSRGQEYFGSWSAALAAAGFDPRKIQKAGYVRYPDKKSVVDEIQRRHEAGLPIDSTSLFKGEHPNRTLHRLALKYFGRWAEAIDAAGIPYEEVQGKRPRRYPDATSVAKEIRRRAVAGIPVNSWAINAGEHSEPILLIRGREYFGSWPAALEAAPAMGNA